MLPLLRGVRILDLCRLIPGDIATNRLADMGADVIKVEEPPYGDYIRGVTPVIDGIGYWDLALNRNKRSIGLNLKSDEGKAIFWRLVDSADAIVEVSKPGTFARLGVDYESVRKHKPDIVYCSVTGYGQTGPYRDFPSHGMNIDAAAGMVKVGVDEDGIPTVVKAQATGMDLGGINAAMAVLAALVQRSRSGEGQYLDVSCWDSAVQFNRAFATAINFGKRVPLSPFAKGAAQTGPRYNTYGTKDDRVILIAPVEKKFWRNFCRVVGREDWMERGQWTTKMDMGTDDPTMRTDIEAVMRTRTLQEWVDLFVAADVPASPVVLPEELADDPHVIARRMVTHSNDSRYPNIRYVSPPVVVPGAEFEVEIAPPRLGEHTRMLLDELGVAVAEQQRLIEAGAVAVAADGGTA
jgi:alpha-methylacyl-CoA racemase